LNKNSRNLLAKNFTMKQILIFILSIIFVNSVYSQTLTATGGWTSTLATSNITEAGNDYPNGSLISATNQTLMTVNSASNSVAYIYVQKSDTSWDSRLIISARRTGTGSGSGGFSTTNGTTLQAITNVPQYFFEIILGSGKQISNIPIQYYITGFTVLLPVRAYTTTLLYTVTN
jgi:hypothetical protein